MRTPVMIRLAVPVSCLLLLGTPVTAGEEAAFDPFDFIEAAMETVEPDFSPAGATAFFDDNITPSPDESDENDKPVLSAITAAQPTRKRRSWFRRKPREDVAVKKGETADLFAETQDPAMTDSAPEREKASPGEAQLVLSSPSPADDIRPAPADFSPFEEPASPTMAARMTKDLGKPAPKIREVDVPPLGDKNGDDEEQQPERWKKRSRWAGRPQAVQAEREEEEAYAEVPDVPPVPPPSQVEEIPEAWAQPAMAQVPSTPTEVEDYRRRLEQRLFERYGNHPQYAGNVGKVSVVLSKPLQPSLDGTRIRAEFDQLVYDPWGRRLPALEQEYYVVIFGSGGVQQVRSDPSIRVGLDMEKTFSEHMPLAADPFRQIADDGPRRVAPVAKMPDWWRPDFADEY